MKTIKRMIAALMAVLVIMTTTYNAYTIPVNATGIVVGGSVLGELLTEFLISLGITYVGYECIDNIAGSGSGLESELHLYLNTTEGSSALKDYVKDFPEFTVIEGGGGSNPEPPEDPDEIIDTKVSGLIISKQLYDFASGFFDYITGTESNSKLGEAINEASNQEITYAPFPSNWHFSSVDNPVYNPYSVDFFKSTYPVFTLEGNSLIEIYTPFDNDAFMMCDLYDDSHIYFRIERTHVVFGTQYNDSSKYNGVNYIRSLKDDYCNRLTRNSSQALYEDSTHLYLCGNIHFLCDRNSYVLNPDGTIVQVVDGQPDQLVIPHLITAEGYLTSVKPIVGMDISALIDAIGKSIADAHPDETPVLSPEAINQIYNNMSNYYDQAVENYYNDTSYIDQSQYITNITNIYEQAIADNPVVDPAIPISPTLGNVNDYKVTGLSDVFPFCIPFDMYDLMTILVAEPEAISFDCTLYFGPYLGEYTLTIDLSIFDPVAKVVRTMELLLYMFGLMLITRSLMRG